MVLAIRIKLVVSRTARFIKRVEEHVEECQDAGNKDTKGKKSRNKGVKKSMAKKTTMKKALRIIR